MMKRFLSVILVFSLLLANTAIASAKVDENIQNVSPDCLYEFENINFGGDLSICKHSEASGKRYITSEKTIVNTTPDEREPEINIRFRALEEKNYYLWIRYSAATSANTSFYIASNSENLSQSRVSVPVTGDGIWMWVNIRTVKANTGENSIRISHSQNGLWLDSFIVTDDEGYLPAEASRLNEIKSEYQAEQEAEKYKIEPGKKAVFVDGPAPCEAEDYIALNEDHMLCVSDELSGGTGVLFTKTVWTPDTTYSKEPVIKISFDAEAETEYYFWVRYNYVSSSSDVIHRKYDNESYAYKGLPMLAQNVYGWTLMDVKSFQEGTHTLNIVPRRPGCALDKIVITTNPLYFPSGCGEWNSTHRTEGYIQYHTDKKPIDKHPRVLLTKEDIPRILENAKKSENQPAWNEFLKYAESDKYEPNESLTSYSSDLIKAIDSKAFYYVVYGDEKKGREAIDYLIKFVSTNRSIVTKDYTSMGETTYLIGLVYDWCYDLLTEEEKTYFQNQVVAINQTNEIGWPPNIASSLVGHTTENILMRDLVTAAIAMYGDSEEIYQNAMGRFFSEYVDARKFLNQSGYYFPGQGYFQYRLQWEVMATLLVDKAYGIKSVFGDGTRNMVDFVRYSRRPDGVFLMDCDKSWNNYAAGDYYSVNKRTFLYLASYYKDKAINYDYLKCMNGFGINSWGTHELVTPAEFLILHDPDVGYVDYTETKPLTKYFPSPFGAMIARTGWEDGINSNSVMAEMKIGENNFGDHQHLDAGGFQLYYKGGLATDTGYYQAAYKPTSSGFESKNDGNTSWGAMHDSNYMTRTIAHNCMLVYDPNEVFPAKRGGYTIATENDGGQEYKNMYTAPKNLEEYYANPEKWKTGEVLGAEFEKDTTEPDWTYLKGDISYAYSDKVQEYERSFMFLNLKNSDVPAALIVFDRIKSADAAFKKTWLLHTQNAPGLDGTRATATVTDSGYNGKLVLDSILPEKDNIDFNIVEGGAGDAWVNGTNYFAKIVEGGINEGGGSRLEISPKVQSKEDLFLNVMQVSDADQENVFEVNKLESDTHVGAVIADRAVLFAKQKDRISSEISFTIEPEGTYQITVADCKEGVWEIYSGGKLLCTATASAEGGVVSFDGASGIYTLKYRDTTVDDANFAEYDDIAENVETEEAAQSESLPNLVRVEKKYVAFENRPKMIDDVNWVCVEEMMGFMGFKGSYDSAGGVLTVASAEHSYTFTRDSNAYIFDDTAMELNYTAREIDGQLYLPLRFMETVFTARFEYDGLAKVATVLLGNANEEEISEIGTAVIPSETNNLYYLNSPAYIGMLKIKFKDIGENPTYTVMTSTDGKNMAEICTDKPMLKEYSEKYMLVLPNQNARYVQIDAKDCTVEEVKVFGKELDEVVLHILDCTESSANQGVEIGKNTYDRRTDTLWAAEGENEWVQYEFDMSIRLTGIEIMWNFGNQRKAYFDILVSDDGENWTYALKDVESSGLTTGLEKYVFDKAYAGKYLRISCHGNSVSRWNGIKEVNLFLQ